MAYKDAGLKSPKIAWCRSPMKGVVAATLLVEEKSQIDKLWDKPRKKIDERLQKDVPAAALAQVVRGVRDPIGERVASIVTLVGCEVVDRVGDLKLEGGERVIQDMVLGSCLGAHDAGWLGYYAFIEEVLGAPALGPLRGHMVVARAGGWFWPMESAVIATERPKRVLLDDKDRPHSATGEALAYPDGFGLCAWHGTRVPAAAIVNPDAVDWGDVYKTADRDLKDALAEIKVLKWSGHDGEVRGGKFDAALAVKRLGGVASLKDLIESGE